MSDCTCSNCTFTGDGRRYCYDCKKCTELTKEERDSRYYDCYPNHLPRLIKEMNNDQEV